MIRRFESIVIFERFARLIQGGTFVISRDIFARTEQKARTMIIPSAEISEALFRSFRSERTVLRRHALILSAQIFREGNANGNNGTFLSNRGTQYTNIVPYYCLTLSG